MAWVSVEDGFPTKSGVYTITHNGGKRAYDGMWDVEKQCFVPVWPADRLWGKPITHWDDPEKPNKPTKSFVAVRHGFWKRRNDEWFDFFECSVCGAKNNPETAYCPHCGAKMDLEDNL